MPATFGPNTPNLIKLWIDDNPCIIEVTRFSQFLSLQTLSMETIGTVDLPNDLFMGLSNLKLLRIANSKAPNLAERTVSLTNLQFSDHIGSVIPDENFMNLKNLTVVFMTGGALTTSLPRFLGASALERITFSFDLQTLPDLSHLPELNFLMFPTAKLVCDHRLCWTLFETFSFSLGFLQYFGYSNLPEFKGRNIYTISKLELRCYDSKLHLHDRVTNLICVSNTYIQTIHSHWYINVLKFDQTKTWFK